MWREGFFNITGFPNDPLSIGHAAVQQKFKDTLPNVIYNNDAKLDLAGLTNTLKPRTSTTVSPLKNEWKQTNIPTDQFNSLQAACENVGNGDQFAHLASLASTVDTSSHLRCGWVYNTADYTQGRGALGTIKGPLKTSASGTWMWDLNAAKKKYHTQICNGITTCGDVGASMYQGRCGWCKKSGKAIPVAGGVAAYPFSQKTSCSSKNLMTNTSKCAEGFANPSPSACKPQANGSLSRDCLLQKVIGAGCNDSGSLYQSLKSGSDNDYLSKLSQQPAWSLYQSRATMPLDETSLRFGKLTIANALDNFNAVQQQAASDLNGGLQFAARDLCYKQGTLDSYDFCSEISDSTTGPFTLDCLQKAFLKVGGQTTGESYPSSLNISTWNALGTWSAVRAKIQQMFTNTRSSDRATQEAAMINFYGITLENKRPPPVVTPMPGSAPAPPKSLNVVKTLATTFGAGLSVDPDTGNIYASDFVAHVIRKITPDGNVTTVAGQPGVAIDSDGIGIRASFNFPFGSCIYNGVLYVCTASSQVRAMDLTSLAVTTLATINIVEGLSFIASDGKGNFYVTSFNSGGIYKVTSGGAVYRINNSMRSTAGIAIDTNGILYVSDASTNPGTVQKVTQDGTLTMISPDCSFPVGLTISPDNSTLYLAGGYDSVIRKIDIKKQSTSIFSGTPLRKGATNGTLSESLFNGPYDVKIDSTGNYLYVGDQNNNLIRSIQLN